MGKSLYGQILHFGFVRYRVNGVGSLQSKLLSLDEVESDTLANITMAASTSTEPTIIANFTNQRAKLQGTTVNFGETFQISRIVVFVKPTAASYPR